MWSTVTWLRCWAITLIGLMESVEPDAGFRYDCWFYYVCVMLSTGIWFQLNFEAAIYLTDDVFYSVIKTTIIMIWFPLHVLILTPASHVLSSLKKNYILCMNLWSATPCVTNNFDPHHLTQQSGPATTWCSCVHSSATYKITLCSQEALTCDRLLHSNYKASVRYWLVSGATIRILYGWHTKKTEPDFSYL